MEKRLVIRLNADRKVRGLLRGFDQFMNIVLEDCEEIINEGEISEIGTVVIRGNSIVEIESLDHL